ncbi:MAG TPA: hypothetical protein VMD08_06800 [Candidatus Baltobacteraceae bacterium]|nr:hypothetical protein [Candidatus Baltobacteraceae bacterium]
MLKDDEEGIEGTLTGVYRLALGGTAVGTGIDWRRVLARRPRPPEGKLAPARRSQGAAPWRR